MAQVFVKRKGIVRPVQPNLEVERVKLTPEDEAYLAKIKASVKPDATRPLERMMKIPGMGAPRNRRYK